MIYWQLFQSFFLIGAFSFGGGYATLPLIQQEAVIQHHWLSMEEFTHLITISQMTPGPIAINSASFVGHKIAGIAGASVATFACILPSCILVSFLAYLYKRFRKIPALQILLKTLRPAVVAMIASSGAIILQQALYGSNTNFHWLQANFFLLSLFLVALYFLIKKKAPAIRIIVLTGLANLLFKLLVH
ncbi:chromate transporter [Atopobacter sp. AH10]|uniref:chromate transporter n=1 Tax=Atopobacter sp. AH10 TaxID=2315861 RepID=UPI000EF1971B|nr:chromate transporter [Atopobacter sp. AH10]RLK64262.1 chromate transporter [Atopobacter sp. AH10]